MDENNINQSEVTEKNIIDKPKKKNLFKRIGLFLLKTFLFIILAVLLIGSTFLFLSQFYEFRHWAIKTGLGFVNKGLVGKIELDDIQFASLNGIKLYGLRVMASGDTVANVRQATVDVLYEPLLIGRVVVNSVTLDDFTLKLLRSRDSTWNVNHISKKDTTPSKPSKLIIDARKVALLNGHIIMVDSLKDLSPTYRINYSNMNLSDVNINLSAKIDLGKKEYYADIKNMRAKENVSKFKIHKFSVQASINDRYLEARKLNLQTDSSDMWVYAKMGRFNIFGDSTEMDITKSHFWATVNAKSISQSDISRFANVPFRVQGAPSLEMIADGTLDDMNVRKFEAVYAKSNVRLNGVLRDILSDNMKYQADLGGSYLVKSDFVIMLPTFDFGKLPSFGEAKLDVMRLKGDLRGVEAEMDVKSAAGSIRGKASAGFGKEVMDYSADLSVRNINLSKILNNPAMASDLNAEIDASGRGTDLGNMSAKVAALASRSSAYGYTLDQLKLDATIAPGGLIALDTLYAIMPKTIRYEQTDVFDENYSKLSASGVVNVADMKSPFYEFNANFTGLDLSHIAKSASLPEHLSGGLTLRGKGLQLDSILADAKIRVDEILFADRALFPFSIDAHIFRTGEGKTVQINSDYFNATLSGKYNISDITETFALQADYLIRLLNDRIGEVFPSNKKNDTLTIASNFNLQPAIQRPRSSYDAALNIEVIDLTPIGAFLPNKQLSAKANLAIKMISDSSHTQLTIDSINVREVFYRDSSMYLRAQPLFISGDMRLDINDTTPIFKYLEMSVIETGDIDFNGTLFTKPRIYGRLADNKAVFKIRSSVNNDIFAGLGGTVVLDKPRMKVTIDSAAINYQERFVWQTDEPILADVTQNSITVQSAKFSRKNAEKIQITGAIENGEARNVVARITGFQLHDIVQMLPAQDQDKLNSFYGMIDSVVVKVDGKLSSPEATAQARMSKIVYSKLQVGNFDADLRYQNSVAQGTAKLFIPRDSVKDSLTLLDVDVRSFPLASGGDTTKKKSSGPIDVALVANKLPLAILSPFVPTLRDLNGRADANFALTGSLPNDLNYEGAINLNGASFVLQPTNIAYYANGAVTINKDKIDIKNLTLLNTSDDSPGGRADVKGYIAMKDMAISDIDITAKTSKFLVLSDATRESMPTLYGRLVMSTGPNPIRFHGSLKEPNLSGDIVVNEGDLRMPPGRSTTTVARTSFEYYVKGDKKEYVFYTYPDTAKVKVDTTNRNVKQQNETFRDENISMMEMMNMDVTARIEGNLQIVIELGAIGDVTAKIGTNDPSIPIRYVKTRYNSNASLYGELQVKEGSTFKSLLRVMNTQGSIYFPTGDITNPNLNLLAEYNGSQTEGASVRRYKVKIYITGTKEVPILRFGYEMDGVEATGEESKINEDALMLLLTGRTKDASSSGFAVDNQISNATTSGFTNIASTALTDIFLRTGVIQSVDLDFTNSRSTSLESANLSISGTYGNITWRIGGSLADFYSSNRIVVEAPISVDAGFLNNIILQSTYSTNPNNQSTFDDPKIWEFKVRLGGSW